MKFVKPSKITSFPKHQICCRNNIPLSRAEFMGDGETRPPNFWTGGDIIYFPPQHFMMKGNVVAQISW